jgi:PDZ domain
MPFWSKLPWLLRRTITVVIGLPLLFVVTMVSAAVAGAAAFVVTWALVGVYSPSLAWDLGVAVVAASWAGLYGAVPPARFLLRLFPLRADERRRWAVMAFVVLGGVLLVGAAAWLLLHPTLRPGKIGGPEASAVGLVVVLAQLVVMLHAYGRRESRVPGHRVLYLRRFRSFSDRVVYRFLLAALPRGARVTALVPAHGGARDLDPFAIGFAGFRWRSPLAAIPRVLVSPDDAWQQHVRSLFQTADSIVVDGSADSASMAFEYGLIETLSAGPRTLVLIDASATVQPPTFTGATTLRYRRDVRSAIPRGLLWLLLFAAYAVLAYREPAYYPMAGLACFVFALPAIFQKSIDRASVRSLRHEMRHEMRQRVGTVPHRPARVLRGALASLALGATPLLAALSAGAYFKQLQTADAKAWQTATARMGSQDLAIGWQVVDAPVPAGFLDPRNVITAFREPRPDYEAIGRRVVAGFAPTDFVARALLDRHAKQHIVMTLWIARDAEAGLMDEAAFKTLVDTAAGQNPPPSVTNLWVLGTGTRFVSQAMEIRYEAQDLDRAVGLQATCTESRVLVRGKPLGMALCRELASESDRQWVRAITGNWIDEILERNPALPPAPGNDVGISGTVTFFVPLNLSGEGRTAVVVVNEVFPGSPAAAARLRPGDRIVAVSGVRLADAGELKVAFARLPPGAGLSLTVERDHDSVALELVKP